MNNNDLRDALERLTAANELFLLGRRTFDELRQATDQANAALNNN
jgi:hypothetical protein